VSRRSRPSRPNPQRPCALRIRRVLGSLVVIVAVLALARAADAHPVPFSYLDLRIEHGAIEGALVVHIFDVGHDLNVEPPDQLLNPATLRLRSGDIATMLGRRFVVSADGRDLMPKWSRAEAIAERQSIRFPLRFAAPASPGVVSVSAHMFPYDPQHQTFLNVYEGEALTQAILDGGRTRFEYFTGTRHGAWTVISRLVPAGVQHIVLGPDHLLFLLGLLLLGGSMRQLMLTATAFTLAHAVTMSLAAFNVVSPPTRLIEPAIALSIIYVGADNLLIKGGRDVRGWIALAFGFIHGFGYASVLREMDLPARALGWSLASVNAGVEIGQLLVVAVLATALAALRARSEALGRQLAFAGSIVVIAAGAFWFIERVFFPSGIS
jgi:hydrogenase/urease accessory protein HupE